MPHYARQLNGIYNSLRKAPSSYIVWEGDVKLKLIRLSD